MYTKVLVADDHNLFRNGLRSLLETNTDFQIVAEARDGREALDLVRERTPHVVLIDIAMPNMNGIEATRRIKSEFPQIKVIALTMHKDPIYVREMLMAGTNGFLLKNSSLEEVVDAIRSVMMGKSYVNSEIATVMLEGQRGRDQRVVDEPTDPSLSNREKEVLQLIAEGKTSKEIALVLSISVKTVENHRQNIMKNLNIHSIAGLTKYAIRNGISFV